jgi:hypothetical protein
LSSTNDGVERFTWLAADKAGHPVLFYLYRWRLKAVDVTEKTNAMIATVRPESRVFLDVQRAERLLRRPRLATCFVHVVQRRRLTVTNLTAATQVEDRMAPSRAGSVRQPHGGAHRRLRSTTTSSCSGGRPAGMDWSMSPVSRVNCGDTGASWAQNADGMAESVAAGPRRRFILLRSRRAPTAAQNISQLTANRRSALPYALERACPDGITS